MAGASESEAGGVEARGSDAEGGDGGGREIGEATAMERQSFSLALHALAAVAAHGRSGGILVHCEAHRREPSSRSNGGKLCTFFRSATEFESCDGALPHRPDGNDRIRSALSDRGPPPARPRVLGETVSAMVGRCRSVCVRAPPYCARSRCIARPGDYAGQELFVVDGDALIQYCLDDALLALGHAADPSFQITHALWLLESTVDKLIKRDCEFTIVFFQGSPISPISLPQLTPFRRFRAWDQLHRRPRSHRHLPRPRSSSIASTKAPRHCSQLSGIGRPRLDRLLRKEAAHVHAHPRRRTAPRRDQHPPSRASLASSSHRSRCHGPVYRRRSPPDRRLQGRQGQS